MHENLSFSRARMREGERFGITWLSCLNFVNLVKYLNSILWVFESVHILTYTTKYLNFIMLNLPYGGLRGIKKFLK